MRKPVVDYTKFRLNKINEPEYRHLWLLLYWPLYGLMFLFAERFYHPAEYHVVHTAIDDMIPFCEWFIIPYFFWFAYLVIIHLYTLLYDIAAFKKLMAFIIVTFTFSAIIFLIYPTRQQLRPVSFERDNFITRFIADFYRFDTDTNVCPSVHVIGSLGVMFAAWHTKGLQSFKMKLFFTVAAVMISISTMFMKQHSVIDVLTAIPVSVIAYILIFHVKWRRRE